MRHRVEEAEEPELITEDLTRSAVPSFGAKKLPVDAEPEKAGENGGATAGGGDTAAEAVPEDISAFYSKIGQQTSLAFSTSRCVIQNTAGS